VQAWRSIIRLDQNQLGNKSSVTHESYLYWVIGRAAQIGIPYPMLRPLTSATPAVPPPLPSKTLEDYQHRLHEANLESDAWKAKYQTSERENDTIMGILEQTTWELKEKKQENVELKDLLKRKDAIIDRIPGVGGDAGISSSVQPQIPRSSVLPGLWELSSCFFTLFVVIF